MSKRSHGLLTGRSRNISRHRRLSRMSIAKQIKEFAIGERVAIAPGGTSNDIPNLRFRGRVGTITERRGSSYVVSVALSRSTTKKLIVPQKYLEKVG
ncbi:MAG: hypothetical protein QXV17_06140 [Candidatus Micrarchaeaceae archaeon]